MLCGPIERGCDEVESGVACFGWLRTHAGTADTAEPTPRKRPPETDASALPNDPNVRREWQDLLLVEKNGILEDLLRSEVSVFIERIESKLAEDAQDAIEFGEPKPTTAAVEFCLHLARKLAPHLVFAPRLKSGVFTEESGGISLVLQSLVTDRRLNCRIASDGIAVTAVMIDEHMTAKNQSVSLSDPNTPRDLAEWVTKRA